MVAKAPSPQTTLVILLGASEWPQYHDFQSSKAFANAAKGIRDYFLNQQTFGLPDVNLLDLFDSEKSADDQDKEISQFLNRHVRDMKEAGNPARDVLLYFVGHGGIVGHNSDFYLAIRRMRKENPSISGLQMMALAKTLKEEARFLRRIVILDCCFAAAAYSSFQGCPDELAIEKTKVAFQVGNTAAGSPTPTKGTTLLCSSGKKSQAMLLSDGSSTMFTKAFLDALAQGKTSSNARLTMDEVKNATADLLTEIPDAPLPVLLSPDQSEGDVAKVPFFPTPRVQEERNEYIKKLERWILSKGLDLVESQIMSALEDETELKRLEKQALKISTKLDKSIRDPIVDGFLHFKGGEFEKANDAFIRSLDIDPLNVSAKLMIVLALIKLKKYEKALDTYWELFYDFSYRIDLIPESLYKAFTKQMQTLQIKNNNPLRIKYGSGLSCSDFYAFDFWCSTNGFVIGWNRRRRSFFADYKELGFNAFSWNGEFLLQSKKCSNRWVSHISEIAMVTQTYFVLRNDDKYYCFSFEDGTLVQSMNEDKFTSIFLPANRNIQSIELYKFSRFLIERVIENETTGKYLNMFLPADSSIQSIEPSRFRDFSQAKFFKNVYVQEEDNEDSYYIPGAVDGQDLLNPASYSFGSIYIEFK